MDSSQLDAALARWLARQPDLATSSYHVQIKLEFGDLDPAQRAALELPGWVIIDWGMRGTGLSAKRAVLADKNLLVAGQLLDSIDSTLVHAHIQVVLAPTRDWDVAYGDVSLAPDLMPVMDAGRASLLNVTAIREDGAWRVIRAYQPPSEENLAGNFGLWIVD